MRKPRRAAARRHGDLPRGWSSEKDMESRTEICCGKLFYAEVVSGITVLECCDCGSFWRTEPGHGLIALARHQNSQGLAGRRLEPAGGSVKLAKPA